MKLVLKHFPTRRRCPNFFSVRQEIAVLNQQVLYTGNHCHLQECYTEAPDRRHPIKTQTAITIFPSLQLFPLPICDVYQGTWMVSCGVWRLWSAVSFSHSKTGLITSQNTLSQKGLSKVIQSTYPPTPPHNEQGHLHLDQENFSECLFSKLDWTDTGQRRWRFFSNSLIAPRRPVFSSFLIWSGLKPTFLTPK